MAASQLPEAQRTAVILCRYEGLSYEEIAEKGIHRNKLRVFNFPIKPSFAKAPKSMQEARRKLDLPDGIFTFLFVFGAEGRGPVKKYLTVLMEKKVAAQVIVVCGHNKALKADMQSFVARYTGPLAVRVHGFARNLVDYVAAADVVVGKSGPNQVFETLMQEKPIIISSFLAGRKRRSSSGSGSWGSSSPCSACRP